MTLREKYRSVLNLGETIDSADGFVEEKDGKLHMGSTVPTQYDKDRLWDELKKVGGDDPNDVMMDVKVANTSYYAKHTVEKGESLSKIAKHYYGDPMMYNRIFEANRGTLDDPNVIQPGQELVIPNKN